MKTDTIQITLELLALLTEIDEFKGAWRALGTLAPERLDALRRVATIESFAMAINAHGAHVPPSGTTGRSMRSSLRRSICNGSANW